MRWLICFQPFQDGFLGILFGFALLSNELLFMSYWGAKRGAIVSIPIDAVSMLIPYSIVGREKESF